MLFRYCCPLKSLNVLRVIAKYTIHHIRHGHICEAYFLSTLKIKRVNRMLFGLKQIEKSGIFKDQ